jgi:hypothetical protein
MNTKQVLYNALQSQLDTKKQFYETYNETVTKPAHNNLVAEIKTFVTSLTPLSDNIKLELSERSLQLKLDESYSNKVSININQNYQTNGKFVELEWCGNEYNLVSKKNKLDVINVLHLVANNLSLFEDKLINDWKVKYNLIYDNDYKVQKDYIDLQYALNSLSVEIQNDCTTAMKEIGFEIKQFKPDHRVDWNYDDNNKQKYKVHENIKHIRIQTGRSKYDTMYVNGFKIINKKGNKYEVELYNEHSRAKIYNILEKKFDSFIEDVANWEYKQADKEKEKAYRRLETHYK